MKTSGLRAAVAIANVGALLFWPLLGSDAMRLPRKLSRADASAAETKRFRLEEATIADVHRAFRAKQLTATQLVNLYLNRIKAYNGTCAREVYNRVPDEKDPNGSRLEGPKQVQLPVGLEFLGRPFEEAKLFEIASAYENVKRHRRPPAGFSRLPREP